MQSTADQKENVSLTPSRRVSSVTDHWLLNINSDQAKKTVNYIESDSEGEQDDEEIFRRKPARQKSVKRQRTDVESEDEFKADAVGGYSDDGMWRPRRIAMRVG